MTKMVCEKILYVSVRKNPGNQKAEYGLLKLRDFFVFIFPNMLTNIYVYVILKSQDKHTRKEKMKNMYEKENGYGEVFR